MTPEQFATFLASLRAELELVNRAIAALQELVVRRGDRR
jgi:hypothetical protein